MTFSQAQYRRAHSDAEQRPQIPATPEAARASLPWWEQRTTDAYRRFEAAKRHFLACRGELAIVRAVLRGEFEPEPELPTHAIGSGGPWPVVRRIEQP